MSNVSMWPAEWDRPFTIGGREVDPVARTITTDGTTNTVEPRIMALLIALSRHAGDVQRRDALVDAIWPNAPGGDQSLSNAMSLLRRALGDNNGDKLIETVPKIGYRITAVPVFAADVAPPIAAAAPAARPWRLAVGAVLGAVAVVSALALRGAPEEPVFDGMPPRVAVMPVTSDEALSPVAYAMTEALRAMLNDVDGLRVLDAGTSYRVAAGASLADVIIEASISGSDTSLKAMLKISEGGNRGVVFSRSVEPPEPGNLALRESLLSAVAEGLPEVLPATSLSRGDAQRRFLVAPTDSLEAYQLFTLGIYEYAFFEPERMALGIEYMRQATVADPGFVDAWVRLGDMYTFSGSHLGYRSPTEVHAKTRDALLRAVTLDPDNAIAQASLGDHYACVQSDLELATRAFERALAADPDIRHHGIVRYYLLTGRRDEAMRYVDRGLELYPHSTWEMYAATGHFSGMGAPERTLETARRLLAMEPDSARASVALAQSMSKLGDHEQAEAIMRPLAQAPDAWPRTRLLFAILLARAGETSEAREIVASVRRSEERAAESHLAMAYGWIGDYDEAIRWLELANEMGEFGLCYLPYEKAWDPLREDPRFQSLVAQRYPSLAN